MLQISKAQMEIFAHQAFERTVHDLVDALDEHFKEEDIRPAVDWQGLSREDQIRLVGQIVSIGTQHGFDQRSDFFTLAEACIRVDPRELLVDQVLEHPSLTPAEKVSVMLELHNEWGAPFRGGQ